MEKKKQTYFQYDEIGKPLFFIEFEANNTFALLETSFFSKKTERFFERSLNFARNRILENTLFNEAHFFELLELDCQRYIYYENPINHDFIPRQFIQEIDPNFYYLKAQTFITKKLQRGEKCRNLNYANEIISDCLNILGREKFEHQFCELIPIHKLHFFSQVYEFVTEKSGLCFSEFNTDNYLVCSIGAYDLYCYQDEKGVFSCWLKEEFSGKNDF